MGRYSAAGTPHYVVSSTLTGTAWPQTRIPAQPGRAWASSSGKEGKDIYLMGGGAITAAAIDRRPRSDEARLIVYPVIAGGENALFTPSAIRRGLELRNGRATPRRPPQPRLRDRP